VKRFLTILLQFVIMLIISDGIKAQWLEPQPNDIFIRPNDGPIKPQESVYVRETDVYWERLLWRIIDVREKENQYFYFPADPKGVRGRKNLAYVLWDAILAGQIELFEDDEMKIPLDAVKIIERATRNDTVQMEVYDDYGEADYTTVYIPHEFKSDDIYQYAIKEAVFLDKSKSGMQVRKIGLAPLEDRYKVIDGETEFMGTVTLFWVPMLSLQTRILFANKETYFRENLMHMPTWEYAFNSFLYTSFITRIDNVWNRSIHDYLTGEDAILESDRIEEEILNIALDMWEY